MTTSNHAKLADFGLSQLMTMTSTITVEKGVKGTAYFMAPETGNGRFSKKSDIWYLEFFIYNIPTVIWLRAIKGVLAASCCTC